MGFAPSDEEGKEKEKEGEGEGEGEEGEGEKPKPTLEVKWLLVVASFGLLRPDPIKQGPKIYCDSKSYSQKCCGKYKKVHTCVH